MNKVRMSLISGCPTALLLTALLLAAAALPAAAQASAYRYTLPAGWTSSTDGSVDTLTPTSQAAGTVQTLLLAPKPLVPDFEAQFDAERSALEAHWGLSAPHAAHFASYASEGGRRYMSFLAVGRHGKFALLVFVATSDEAFNRLAPQATQLWQTLQVAP